MSPSSPSERWQSLSWTGEFAELHLTFFKKISAPTDNKNRLCSKTVKFEHVFKIS